MSNQPRVVKVLAALLASMTAGAIVLMALGNNPPSAGPFSLSAYRDLDLVKEAIRSQAAQSPSRWNCVEIYYSGTKGGNIEQLASLTGLADSKEMNCHFVVCNGLGGGDGQIQSTEKWQRQWSIVPSRTWYGSDRTIRLCAIAGTNAVRLTNCQIRRAEALVDSLCEKFDIQAQSIHYPGNWPR